jgi:hypothetical protein
MDDYWIAIAAIRAPVNLCTGGNECTESWYCLLLPKSQYLIYDPFLIRHFAKKIT